MKNILLLIVIASCALVIITIFAINLWLQMSDVQISYNGLVAIFVGAFFTGALLVETLFSLDGLGLLSYESVIKRDYPVVMGTLFFFSLIGLVAKLINDLMYVLVDPRIKFERD